MIAQMGPPTGRYKLPDGNTRLEFARGPAGRETFMVNFDAAGGMVDWEQVMDLWYLTRITPGMSADEGADAGRPPTGGSSPARRGSTPNATPPATRAAPAVAAVAMLARALAGRKRQHRRGALTRMTVVYGIADCDRVKKARAWLQADGVAHDSHDFKRVGLPEAKLDGWIAELGWERLLNRQGTTWRRLDDATRASAADAAGARALMLGAPSIVERPVVEWPDGTVSVGFDAVRFGDLNRSG